MNEKKYDKKLKLQQEMISRQSKEIESLKLQNEKLKLELEEKDKIISSVVPLRNKLAQDVAEVEKYKEEYKNLIDEVRKMKEILNQEVYKNRWRFIKFLIR